MSRRTYAMTGALLAGGSAASTAEDMTPAETSVSIPSDAYQEAGGGI